MGKIFISHSSANNAEALAIADWLAEQGWTDVFLDLDPRRGLVAGDRWQAALKAAAEQCELILILISPEWARSKWCLAEFLLAKQMNKQILGVLVKPTPLDDLPVELTAEWQLVDLGADDAGWSVTLSPPRFTPETTVHFSGTGLTRLRTGLEKAGLDATTFPWPPASDPGRSPYRGLLPLDADDAGIFFGRDGAVVLTLDALRGLREGAAPRFVTILGASGAGKSSFLRAGLLPRLARDSRHFTVLPVLRPERAALSGEHGFAAVLEQALKARGLTRNRADIRDAVAAGADAVAPLLRELVRTEDMGDVAGGAPPTLVLAVDQAEELLTADNSEAPALLQLLAGIGGRDDPAVMVIFTVRSDSFDQLQARPELAATQPHHLVDLPPIAAGSFGEIIRGPARRLAAAGRKLRIDETLVDALLSDIEAGGTKDALPLLAFTLERLYTDYGADGDLQLSEYERLGRIRGAIEAAVEQALAKADGNPAIPRDRAARLLLLRRGLIPWLAGIDPASGSPRRRVARLAEVPEEARSLIELMVEQRLLATDFDAETRERTIEPAHEALLRQWGALDGWLVEDSADLAIIEAVRRAASEWDANARASEFIVHRGGRLQTAEQLAAGEKFATYLTSVDRAYLGAARHVENAAVRRARAARTRWVVAASVAGVVLVAGATAGWFTWSAAEAASQQAAANFAVAQSEAAMREGRREDAALHALDAYDLLPGPVTRTAALAAGISVSPHIAGIIPVEGRTVGTAFSGGALFLLGAGGTLMEVDPAARRIATSSVPAPSSPPIALLPRDGSVAMVHADASISVPDGTVLAGPPATPFAARAGAFSASADGRVLALEGLAGDLLVRDCRALPCTDIVPQSPSGAADLADAIAVSPDGGSFAVAWAGGSLSVHGNLSPTPTIISDTAFAPEAGEVASLAWNAAADSLAAVTGTGDLVTLDAATGEQRRRFAAVSTGRVLAWSPADDHLAYVCAAAICISDSAHLHVTRLEGHTGAPSDLKWSADGTHLASVAPNEPVRLWTLEEDPRIVATLRTGAMSMLTAVAVDRANNVVAAGDERGTVWTWSGDAPAERHVLASDANAEPLAPATAVTFLADGRVGSAHQNDGIAVWSPAEPAPQILVRPDNIAVSRLAALGGDIRLAAPLGDKTTLVLTGADLAEKRIPADPSAPLDQWGIAAAAEPNTAYISYSDGSIRRRDLGAGTPGTLVFDASQRVCGAAPTTDNNGARSLAVSPDGKWLAATRSDDRVVVHSLSGGDPLCLELLAPDSKTVAFSPDSSRLAILSATDRLYVFDLARPDTALILGALAVPESAAVGQRRATSWLDWLDDGTVLVARSGGIVQRIALDPTGWRARMDSLRFTQ